MKKVALILSGCGHSDGSEIREAVFTMLEIDKHSLHYDVFAPNIPQTSVVNHRTGRKWGKTECSGRIRQDSEGQN